MNHYIDIKILPDPEFKTNVLLNALFAKFHRALVSLNQGEIGISFPAFKHSLGNVLRLHGTQENLDILMNSQWVAGLNDYCNVSKILTVPETAEHIIVKRVQAKSNAFRLRRRSIVKGWVTAEQAIARIPLAKEKTLKLPFLQLKSHSTGQHFRLFIEHGQPRPQPTSGSFSSYGLSAKSTVPWF